MGKRNRQSTGTREYDALLETVREARERAGLSQREMGRRLGFHPTIYGKIERGERLLDVLEFVRLATALGISPIELMGDYLVNLQEARVKTG